MEYYLAKYSSMTLASRVKKRVNRDGSYVGVIHTPKCISKGGCTYSLRFKKNKLNEVENVSHELGIKIKGLFKEIKENGEKRYETIK